MAALIQANRERRRQAEAAAARGGGGREPSANEGAQANLNRNLRSLSRSDGTGGVFQIRRMGAQTAEFAFNGWNRARRGQWRELIEVQAGPDGDLERAVVRRMIALIREHYSGNFQWESYRLDRVLVLSAAPEDNEGLEEFLLREFFQRRPVGAAQLPRLASQMPASTTAPPTNCAAPIASPKSDHAKIVAITGWMRRLTEESEVGRCAKA